MNENHHYILQCAVYMLLLDAPSVVLRCGCGDVLLDIEVARNATLEAYVALMRDTANVATEWLAHSGSAGKGFKKSRDEP